MPARHGLSLLAALTVLASAPAAQTVRDSVRMDLGILTFYNSYVAGNTPRSACGASVVATWPNVVSQFLDREGRYNDYSRVATEGMYVPYGYGEWDDAPEGTVGHLPQLGGSSDGPGDCNLAAHVAGAQYRINGGTGPLNGSPFRVTEWYATFSIPGGTPLALFTWKQAGGLAVDFDGSFESGQSREADASAPDGKVPVASYAWDFGDGQTGSGATPTHTYDAPGDYTVLLTVTDDDGDEATREETVEVFSAHLTVDIVSATEEASKGDTITVVARVTNTGSEAVTDVSAARSFTGIARAPDAIAHPAGQIWRLSVPRVPLADGEEDPVTRARLEPGESVEVSRRYVVDRPADYRIFGQTNFAPADIYLDWSAVAPVSARPTVSDSVEIRQPCLEREARCAPTLIKAPRLPELFVSVEGRPGSVPVGATFEVRAVIRNEGEGSADDVHAAGTLSITSTDGGAARLLSGPTPASLVTLDPASADTLVWTAEAEAIGTLAFEVTIVGTAEDGSQVTATPQCLATRQRSSPQDEPDASARAAQAGCLLEVRPVAFTAESAFMEEDDLVWPDSTITLRWTAPEASTVEIHASMLRDPDPEDDADWPLVVATGLDAAAGEVDWAPPQEAVSPTVRLRIRDEDEPSAYGVSERTRVRYGWHLTRVVEDDDGETTYEYFDPAKHAWSDNAPGAFGRWRQTSDTELLLEIHDGFAGDALARPIEMDVAFDEEAWRRDAFTFENEAPPPPPPRRTEGGRAVMMLMPQHPRADYQRNRQEGQARHLDRSGTPSWRSVAFAYGMEGTYGAASPVLVPGLDEAEMSQLQPLVASSYFAITQTGSGLCYGLAWSALLSFQMPEAFAARYGALASGLGAPETASIPLTNGVIDAIGAVFWTQVRDNRDTRYDDPLFTLSAALLSDDASDDVVVSSPTHTVLPYRIEVTPSGDFEVVVHNRTYPGTAAQGAGNSRFGYDGTAFTDDGDTYLISAEEPAHFFEPVAVRRLASRTEITAGTGTDLRVGEPACDGEALPITVYRNDPTLAPVGVEVPDCPVGFTTRGVQGTASATVTTADGSMYTFSRFGAAPAEVDSLAYDGTGLVYVGAGAPAGRTTAEPRPVAFTLTDADGRRAAVGTFVDAGTVSAAWADVAGRLRVTNDGGSTSYAVLLDRPGAAALFVSDDIAIEPGAVHTIRPNWPDVGSEVQIDVDDDGDGTVDRTVAIADQGATAGDAPPDVPPTLALGAPFPNPSRGNVSVAVSLPEAGPARLALYDALGRVVAVAHDGPLGAGRYSLVLPTDALPAGVYVVRLDANGEAQTHRLTIVH